MQLTERLAECGFEVVADPLKELWVPDQKAIEECRSYGENFCRLIGQE